jgi:hypothetical protein
VPPKIQNSTLVALEAEASNVLVPANFVPAAGMTTLVVGCDGVADDDVTIPITVRASSAAADTRR